MEKVGRNQPCPCGSGKKFKKCCLQKTELLAAQERATELMNEKRYAEAEELLVATLHENDDAIIRNNLAVTVLEQGDPERCLDVLGPCLDPEIDDLVPNPFTFALASRAFALLGERDDAYLCLEQAENLFAGSLNHFRHNNVAEEDLHTWKEYTVAMMKAAADLGDFSRVLELYRRWEKEHVNWESYFLAAVAAFNLKNYEDAATFWRTAAGEWETTLLFERIARLVGQGAIPHFELNFKVRDWEDIGKILMQINEDEAYLTQALQDTNFLLFALAIIFDPNVSEQTASELIEKMVCQGESWGEELGQRLLQADDVPAHLKMAAARGLIAKGVYQPHEPISMVLDGEKREIRLEKYEVAAEPDEETAAAMQKAKKFEEEGRLEKAIDLLEDVCLKDSFFPPVAIKLASLLFQVERYEEAERYLRMVETVMPEDYGVWFNLALIISKQGRFEEAAEYLRMIKEIEDDPEKLERVEKLQEYIDQSSSDDDHFERLRATLAHYEERRRKKVEAKPLSPKANLATCLRNMPAVWLTGLCYSLQVKPAPRRGEREQQCRMLLLQQERLRFLMDEYLEASERELLIYLLRNGGCARLSAVSRKFGTMEGDGFFWEDELPGSPLGVLWALGLAAVGKTKLGQRHEKIVVIPKELRQPLAGLLGENPQRYQ